MIQTASVSCNMDGCDGTCSVCSSGVKLVHPNLATWPPQRHGDPRFYKLLEEIADLHSRKNHDYSRAEDPLSNFRMSEQLGIDAWKGVLVRMSDKWARIQQLANGKEPKNESLRDSLIDNAVYSLICVLLLEERQS